MTEVITPTTTKDNSQIFGILGLVLPFAGLSVAGLVLAILGYFEAKKHNSSRTLSIVGIWISSFFTAIGLLYLLFILTMILLAAPGV